MKAGVVSPPLKTSCPVLLAKVDPNALFFFFKLVIVHWQKELSLPCFSEPFIQEFTLCLPRKDRDQNPIRVQHSRRRRGSR